MNKLLYKELKLNIHPLFYLATLLGGLILIPGWLYFIALMYVFFITITNVMSNAKSQNDFSYCSMLPIRRKDMVKARIMSIHIIQLLHIAVAIVFALINKQLYRANLFMEPNAAFFGLVFIMYGIFNIIFFPMFYKTGHKIGLPAIFSITATVLYAGAVEMGVLLIPKLNYALDYPAPETLIWKLATLAVGIVFYIVTGILSYKLSAKRFEKLGL